MHNLGTEITDPVKAHLIGLWWSPYNSDHTAINTIICKIHTKQCDTVCDCSITSNIDNRYSYNCRHCIMTSWYGNAFRITSQLWGNPLVTGSKGQVIRPFHILVLLAWLNRCSNSPVVSHFRHHGAYVGSLYWKEGFVAKRGISDRIQLLEDTRFRNHWYGDNQG